MNRIVTSAIFSLPFSLCSLCCTLYSIPRSPSAPNIDAFVDQPMIEPSSTGNDTLEFDSDLESFKYTAYLLANELGFYRKNGKIFLDISYPRLWSYVERLRKQSKIDDSVYTVLRNVNEMKSNDLYQESLQWILDTSELTDEFKSKFKQVFDDMVRVSTGEQRIKSLIVLQILINNRIGNIGGSFYFNKKITVKERERISYRGTDHSLMFNFNEDNLIFVGSEESQQCPLHVGQISGGCLHELSHAFHFMLGFSGGAVNVRNDISSGGFFDNPSL
ncbi:MAG: hypothetical protein LBQ43_03335, partial [Holosporales bacterium]|nr:hypothetical protein [Holosporales bacterium]